MKKNNSSKKIKKKIFQRKNWLLNLRKKLFLKLNTPSKKIIFFSLFGVLVFIIIYLIVNFAFLFNFLIGYDTIMVLSSSNTGLDLVNGEVGIVDFSTYLSTKSFCKSTCSYSFIDLSSDEIIDSGSFSKKYTNPFKKSYDLIAPLQGVGQKLYNFEIVCLTENKGLCKSDESGQKRNILVVLNHKLNFDQEKLRNESRENIELSIEKYFLIQEFKQNLSKLYFQLNESLNLNFDLNFSDENFEEMIIKQIESWNVYEYELNSQKLFLEELNNFIENLNESNFILIKKVLEYNLFLNTLEDLEKQFFEFQNFKNISLDNFELINNKIIEYNGLVFEMKNRFSLDEMISKINTLNDSLQFNLTFVEQNSSYFFKNVSKNNLTKINFNMTSESHFDFPLMIEKSICCYLNNCQECCNESCKNDHLKYPILLIHGHSFNERVSAEKSLNDMLEIQYALAKDGFLNGGQIKIGNENNGRFVQTNQQLVFVGSYYFDIYENDQKRIILQTKSDDINTYALRLNDLIEFVKKETGREKVVLVSHSMGGLVSRRYLQIYGDNSVSELIMLGTPNNGIDGTILKTCSVFGANSNCKDMDENSLLMNKLTYGIKPKIPVATIIGQGCKTDGEESDGIVKVRSAYLNWTDNYYVNGTCSGVDFFHINMRNPEKYPEVYEIIKNLILDDKYS